MLDLLVNSSVCIVKMVSLISCVVVLENRIHW